MFKKNLSDAEEITDFIIENSVEFIDEELVYEYFTGCRGVLKSVLVQALKAGNQDSHIRDYRKEKSYKILPFETMPPLVVENGIVIDGNHRLRIAKNKGIKEIEIYDILTLE